MGCNAVRMAHNPPAPELLDLTDRMGFLVMDEIFDTWTRGKTANDFYLIFEEWHEADIRNFVRRDRNHPSVLSWSFGNEVAEQTTGQPGGGAGGEVEAYPLVREEDMTRPGLTASMNAAKANMPFPGVLDVVSLKHQGEGIRDAPNYSYLPGIRTPPAYGEFHAAFPEKMA